MQELFYREYVHRFRCAIIKQPVLLELSSSISSMISFLHTSKKRVGHPSFPPKWSPKYCAETLLKLNVKFWNLENIFEIDSVF
jgi:hypothetical protein